MTEQLRETFRDLAEDAGTSASGPPEDLWQRGRRARRQRVASAVLVAGVVLGLAGLLLPAVGPRAAEGPASYDAADLAMPDHLWVPSSWAPSAGAGDKPGPMALIAETPRRAPWLVTSSPEWFGVSAVDQSYVWLDLPGRENTERAEAVLSPDGRRVGYFVAGEPSRRDAQSDVVGYAVYDMVTGEVHRHEVPTERGLAPYEMLWSPDSARLVVSYGQYRKRQGSSSWGEVTAWDPEAGDGVVLDVRNLDGLSGSGLGGVITWDHEREGVLVWNTETGERRRITLAPGEELEYADSIRANPSGTMLAMRTDLPLGPRSSTTGLGVGRLSGDTLTDVHLVTRRWQLNQMHGWLDDERVLGHAYRRGVGMRYVAFDTRTGEVEPVITRTVPPDRGLLLVFAENLLQRPFAEGVEPPAAWHPWWPGAVALGTLAGLLVLRRRPRIRP